MPRVASGSGGGGASDSITGALVPFLPDSQDAVVYPLGHGLKPPISRVSISWARGNTLRVSVFRSSPAESDSDEDVGGKVMEVRPGGNVDGQLSDAQWRRIAYGSVSPFALLQSRRNSALSVSKMGLSPSPYHLEWWEYVSEYSKDVSSLLGNPKSSAGPVIEDPKEVLKKVEEPTCLKAAWDLMEMFYADKLSQAWLPERLVDWLADYDSLLSDTQATVYLKLMEFQGLLVTLLVIEDDSRYWEVISSALAVGWLEIAVKMLRLHGSYQLDQLGSRETENGLVEAVAVLISKMPRLRPELGAGKLGECFKTKPDFMKAWERWRAQVTKLESSAFWLQCDHLQTREGLKNMLQIMLGNASILSTATCNWMELYISHILYIRPFTVGLESMYSLAQKCIQLKPMTIPHKLMRLIVGILGENTEVILAECSRDFGTWMAAHAIEFLTAGSDQAEVLLHEERDNLGGINIEELHRLIYAQVLSSHILTWQSAFVPNRSIQDNILVAHKAFVALRRHQKGNQCAMAIKVDIHKAYDSVFCIHHCISSVEHAIPINGDISSFSHPGRGIHRGDRISPYLCLLVSDVLSRMLDHAVNGNVISGFKINRRCPTLTHLLFVDDTILFGCSSRSEA